MEAGSGAAGPGPRHFLKMRFYPVSRPRWVLWLAFLNSSHRALPLGEVSGRTGPFFGVLALCYEGAGNGAPWPLAPDGRGRC